DVAGICDTGEDAITRAVESKADLVLMDITLAGGSDGIEAARQLRSRNNIPVVFLTAHTDTATLERAILTKPYGYLLKPFDPRTLKSTIDIALSRHKAEFYP